MSLREQEFDFRPRPESLDDESDLWREVGSSARSTTYEGQIWDDYNPDMQGTKRILIYDEMRRSDGVVRAALRIIKAPLLAAEWYVEPAEDSEEGREVAKFVWAALNGMSRTFIQVLWEALLCVDYGYYPFEKVFKLAKWRPEKDRARERDVVVWKKWAPRHPLNTTGWVFDAKGGIDAIKQNRKPDGWEEVPIPVRDLLIFTLDEEGGNPEGISLLRSAYPHWYYRKNLYRIDAIQKERHGIGIPQVELPPNATTADKTFAKNMVENLRTNEKAGVVKPYGWVIDFIEPKGQQVNVLDSAKHHGVMVLMNMLAAFEALGTQESGSRAVGSVQEDIFVKSTHYVADLLRGVINKWAIPQLVEYNFNGARYPELKVRRLGDTADMRALSITIRNLVESGAFTPDGDTEEWLRRYLDFPAPSDEIVARGHEERIKKPGDFSNRVEKPTE